MEPYSLTNACTYTLNTLTYVNIICVKVRYTVFDHFLQVAFKNISSFDNTSDDMNFAKKTKIILLLSYLSTLNKSSGFVVLETVETALY